MTQNASDVEIANQGFAAFRQDLNDVLEDITTLHSGTAAPSTTYANQWWYETDTDKLYIRNEDNDAWIEILTLDQANDHLATLGASITLDGTGNVSIDSGDFTVDTDTLHVDSTNNRVGIATSSPEEKLTVAGIRNEATLRLKQLESASDWSNGDDLGAVEFSTADPSGAGSGVKGSLRYQTIGSTGAGTYMSFNVAGTTSGTNDTERMRIDSSGNLLVGKTSSDTSAAGVEARSNGQLVATLDGGTAFIANRKTSDGDVARFMKDGSTRGAVGTFAGYPYFGHAQESGAGLLYVSTSIRPFDVVTESQSDNDFDLGQISYRFDDIYATNGTIQTSDQNEKQQIASLTDAEITAAKAISKLFKTFKWNDKVEAKGDAARTHTGVIAQDVQQAMTDAGLDAGDYAFFISSTWWETQTEVPAVEAVEAQDAVYDDDGNIVTETVEAVEAKDAYIRTDTYDTAEEAPEGATERTRLGIRYPELLAFIGAATEQRLADIETRLTALEAE